MTRTNANAFLMRKGKCEVRLFKEELVMKELYRALDDKAPLRQAIVISD